MKSILSAISLVSLLFVGCDIKPRQQYRYTLELMYPQGIKDTVKVTGDGYFVLNANDGPPCLSWANDYTSIACDVRRYQVLKKEKVN